MFRSAQALADALAQSNLREDETGFWRLLDLLPAAIYATSADGTLTFANRIAIELAGREPRIGVDKWCVGWRLYSMDGTPLPHDQCPMAVAIREKRPVRDASIIVERPDGRRVPIIPFPTPLHDAAGRFIGAINVLLDISNLKQAEEAAAQRADEQAALYRFTARLHRARAIDEMIDAALDAIVEALHVDRAAVLLFDEAGVARFRGWRGLSAAYRAAVEGHCPWRRGERDAQPIFAPDIELTDESEAIKRTVRAEDIVGLAFIPLAADGGVIGKFMAYYGTPHIFSEEERALALTIARQLGFSIERRRADEARRAAEEALRGREERLRAVFNSAAIGVAVLTPEARFLEANAAFCAIVGYAPAELLRLDCAALTHEADLPAMAKLLEELLRGDRDTFMLEKRYIRKDGEIIWVQNSVSATHYPDGGVQHLVALCQDVSERKRSEAQRDLLVAELSHRVKNTLATVMSIARQSFGQERDVDAAREAFDGRIRALAQTHSRLAEANWDGVLLSGILADELAPYRDESGANIEADGPSVGLAARHAVALGMAFHELATNAAKHGALSAKGGKVSVSWSKDFDAGRLAIAWRETGGPMVAAPARKGFGRLLLERALAADIDGEVKLDFTPAGVHCAITVPLAGAAAT